LHEKVVRRSLDALERAELVQVIKRGGGRERRGTLRLLTYLETLDAQASTVDEEDSGRSGVHSSNGTPDAHALTPDAQRPTPDAQASASARSSAQSSAVTAAAAGFGNHPTTTAGRNLKKNRTTIPKLEPESEHSSPT
jgi:hypothetical protein